MESSVFFLVLKQIWTYLFTNQKGERKGSHRSIVRVIGTALPLPPAPRVYLNLALWKTSLRSQTPSIFSEDEGFIPSEESNSNNDASVGTPNSDYGTEIKQLKDELESLRKQVAHILEAQQVSTPNSPHVPSNIVSTPAPPPPPLPPPPPPLPSFNLATPVSTPLRKKASQSMRSPGGRPIKKPLDKAADDPSDILAEVLKRRFTAVQQSDSETSIFSEINSPEWKACCA